MTVCSQNFVDVKGFNLQNSNWLFIHSKIINLFKMKATLCTTYGPPGVLQITRYTKVYSTTVN